jgi:hypothetical protein
MGLAYFTFRDRPAADLRRRLVTPSIDGLVLAARQRGGLGPAEAAEYVERFIGDLRRARALRRRKRPDRGKRPRTGTNQEHACDLAPTGKGSSPCMSPAA